MRSVAADFACEIVEFNGEDNHVHLLVNFPPKVALSKLVDSRLDDLLARLDQHTLTDRHQESSVALAAQPPKDFQRRPLRPEHCG